MYKEGEVKAQEFLFNLTERRYFTAGPGRNISFEQFLKKIHFVGSASGADAIVVFYTESKTKL